MNSWESIAKEAFEVFGAYIDWDEFFFICPECAEPIYEEDFLFEDALCKGYCPICGAPIKEDCALDNYYD